MDNFLLQIIVNELGLRLGGHRVGGIYQIGATDLAIDFYASNERWLMISTDPQRLAFYLTARNPKHGAEELRSDTAFAALAKKHLGGSRLATAEKLGYDRVVHLEFNVREQRGQGGKSGQNKGTTQRELVVALTGRSANLLLVEDSRVIASLRERDETIMQYVDPPPPADKFDPFLCSAEKLDELIASSSGDLAEASRRMIGFSPVYARELAVRARRETPEKALRSLLNDLFESPPKPAIYSLLAAPASPAGAHASMEDLRREIGRDDFDLVLAPIELESLSDKGALRFASVIEAADAYYSLIDERRRFFALKRKLRSHILSQLRQRRDLLNHLARDLDRFSNGELHQRYGELLLANLRQAVKTSGGFQVTDFYDEAQPLIDIPSAGIPTPQEAAEHYFKLARKARRGFEKVSGRLPQVEDEIARLEKHLAELDAIADAAELDSLAAQLNLPAPEKKPSQPAKKEVKIPGVRRYRSSDGYEIMVGRAGADNDHLTFRVAKSYDLWFHAADYPGSHVVLRNPQRKSVPPRAITEAAQLAAKFSQARTLPKAAVNYCERKYVTKMKGFAPGQVRLSSFKTVMVEPAEAGERLD
jgi:predicted ribosome quality control (RQC) complex YloA/Tae2 family protein